MPRDLQLTLETADLDATDDLEYLLALIRESLADDEAFADDGERVRWAIAHWCQETGFVPDLRDYDTGEIVPHGEQSALPHDHPAIDGREDE